ncbi:MAG: tRNA 2-thiouridine(34) synthase MnmA [Parcubacteria group bacterium]|nr:tRNA 2-thiouridine(34) synthase MnmA [Parcubacteria group bacterium]
MNVTGKRIFVGLSGGVDSGVSAALLKDQGAEVTGVFIKGWYPPGMPCTWASERRDAMRVAARLQIPFTTLDASAEYKRGVIEYLVNEYRAGRTPNPDVMCNREVKFGAFYRFAKESGADAIATGHYRSGEKDQSYFLWAVPKEALEYTVFPVGHLEKGAVRVLAKKYNLPVALKKDSQGICFLGSISVEEFLMREFGIHRGRAVDEEGNTVGMHNGVLLSTIGQRVSLMGTEEGPWFVESKDLEKNELVVTKGRLGDRRNTNGLIQFTSPNWLSDVGQIDGAQYRYRGALIPGRVINDIFVASAGLPETPAPGQSLAFYHGTELVGGGIITV